MTLGLCVLCGKNPAPVGMACDECDGKDPLNAIDGCDPDVYLAFLAREAREVKQENERGLAA